MNEIPILFGPESSLVGVLCEPDAGMAGTNLACLMFNAGVVPRIGPHRFNVKLSRTLAGVGIPSLRFDLSGLGDSRPAGGQRDFLQQAVADLRAAMGHLERHQGIHRFILIGNCSGAIHAYWAALADERIIGILMFDGFWYRTRWTRFIRHWKRFRAGTWHSAIAAARRSIASLLRSGRRGEEANPASIFSTDESVANPPRPDYCRAMRTLVDRGVAVFLVFSGGTIDYYSYARQFRDGFAGEPFVDKVRCDFLPEIDHTLLSLESQRRFIEIIRDWISAIANARGSSVATSGAQEES